jgi:hypothetical protein
VRPLPALLALALLAWGAAPAAAQTPAPVQGAGDAAEAPPLRTGAYVDLIGEPETLWYAIEATAGQEIQVVAVLRGRAEGPRSETGELRVALLDAQRQPSGDPATAPFTGQADVQVEVDGERLPEVGADGAYLTVGLASPTGANDLRDIGYQLEFALQVTGEASADDPEPTVPAQPEPEPLPLPEPASGPSPLATMLPVMIFAFALGAFGGFELTRSRLRRR